MTDSKIEMMNIDDLKPYPNNPRSNDEAVKYVKNSIQQFGFKQPIVVDKDNVIIVGHTRRKAAMELGIKEVPVIVADDLSTEEANAYRLADNKTAETATWDFPMLDQELDSIQTIDMSAFNFKVPVIESGMDSDQTERPETEEDDSSSYGEAREKTINAYHLYDFDALRVSGKYQMPMIRAEYFIPDDLIGFNYVLSTDDTTAGVHFYIDDYQFERIWNNTGRYLERLSMFPCVLTPDFSLYMDMPYAMKVWNVYRSRMVGQIMQDYGMKVIPTLSWAEPETFEFAFDGIEPGGVVSVSTIGVKQDEEAGAIWKAGMDEALRRLQPSDVLVYGGDIGYAFRDTVPHYYENQVIKRWKGDL